MRILAIRGENLASLARPFELDLTAEPLAGAGLFAITGETGSGKSTILDALCLALYGQYPRVAVGRQENAPDPSGKDLSISDGRAILRRGAAAGFAEVDFLGHDGVGYRVRWAVARARGKANGRLQGVQRSLRRLADDSAVAEGITSVLKEIEARTDLTFEQFRRTVLLAQGDFDAFLLAEERDRADLLEKVTGTEIYGSISMQVRQGTDELRREVDALEQRRLDIGLLDAGARLALEESQEGLARTIGEQEHERGRLAGELEKRRIIAVAQENLCLAAEQLGTAQQRRDEAQEDITALAELDAVEHLRGLQTLAKDAAEALPGAAQKVTETATSCDRAANAAQAADARLVKAAEAAREAEAIFKNFGPVWTEAEGLDAQIASASEELQKAQREAGNAEETAKAQRATLEGLQGELATATGEHEKATQQLVEQSANAALAERLDEVLVLLQQHEEQARSSRAATLDAAAAKTAVDNLLEEVEKAESRIQTADQLRKELALQGIALRNQLNDLNESELQSLEAGLAQLVVDLREAHRLAGRATAAAANLAEAERKRTQALEEEEQARGSLDTTQAKMDADTASRARLVPLYDLAQQSVSEQAAHLRSFLLPDMACPVCGAEKHPYRNVTDAEHPTGALEALAESLRSQRQELDLAIAHAANDITAASAQRAAAEARLSEASRSKDAARLEAANTVAEFVELRPAIFNAITAFKLTSPLPTSLDIDAKQSLVSLGKESTAAHQRAKEGLASAKRIRTQLDIVHKQESSAQTQFETEHHAKQEQITKHHAAELALQQQNAMLARLVAETWATERELLPFLAGAGLTPEDLHRDAAGTRATLRLKAMAYRTLKERIGALEKTVRELAPKSAEAATILQASEEQLTRSQADLAIRNATLEEKQRLRAALLEGEATATHRTRFNDTRLAAIASQNSANIEQSAAASAHQGAMVAHEQAVSAHAEARTRANATQNRFSEACAEIARSCDWVLTRLAVPAATRAEMRTRLQRIELAYTTACANISTRTTDLETARAGVDESVSAQELSSSLTVLSDEIRAQQQHFGENAAELRRDEQARAEAQSLSAEIDAKRAELTVWQAVDDAVGSPDGSRFRKFVQSITLEQLVRLANDHLSALGPRYQLAPGGTSELAVNVVDRDMANELRAARSLSGGERFLVSLSLALALSGLEGRSSFVDTLFIDEGFGSLDQETLDIAIDALESLHGRGRKVAVITHVAAMIDRIAVQVRVEKLGGGHSVVRLTDGLVAYA
jgi:exonuclease SbcC